MYTPSYKNRSIGSVYALSKLLGVEEKQLICISGNVQQYVIPNKPVIKSNGEKRYTYRVLPPLKNIQTRIRKKILDEVDFPLYIQGSVRDRENPRSYITDAAFHTSKKIVISADISNFFPSIDRSLVKELWQYFFHFPPDVSEVLTELTTYQGHLYQGAATSPSLANLVFCDKEPALVEALEKEGLTYSRYVDDITVSSAKAIGAETKTEVVSMIVGLLLSKQLRLNRKKLSMVTRKGSATVHGLNVQASKPSLDRKKREGTRAAVWQCERMFSETGACGDYRKVYASTLGKVRELHQLHPGKGAKLLARMEEIKPL